MRVTLIVNPAAGREEPVLSVANRVFREHEVDWEITVTREPGDARRAAAESTADRVLVYGGDGTVGEAARGLLSSAVPLAILPGGTGNALAQELGVPLDLEAALTLAVDATAPIAQLDVGDCNGEPFFQRVGVGLDAEAVRGAAREAKTRFGWLAYLHQAARAFLDAQPASFELDIDGHRVTTTAVTAIVANVSRLGRGGLHLAPGGSPTDGVFELILLRRADAGAVATFAEQALDRSRPREPLAAEALADCDDSLVHLQCRTVQIRTEPSLPVQRDGEAADNTPVTCRVDAAKLAIVVPAGDDEGRTDGAD